MEPDARTTDISSSTTSVLENDEIFLPYLQSNLEELFDNAQNSKKACQTAKKSKMNSKGSQNKMRTCDKCPFTTSYSGDFQRHLRRHMKPCFPCSECNMPFMTVGHLNGHKRTVHQIGILPRDKIWKCELCDYTTRHASDMHRHKKRHKSAPISCKFCNRPFFDSNMLTQHLKRVHGYIENSQANINEDDNVKTKNRMINSKCIDNSFDQECRESRVVTDKMLAKQIQKLNKKVIDLRRERSDAKRRKRNVKKEKEVSFCCKIRSKTESNDRSTIGGSGISLKKVLSQKNTFGDKNEISTAQINCAFCRFRATSYKQLQEHLDGHDIDELSNSGELEVQQVDNEINDDDTDDADSESSKRSFISVSSDDNSMKRLTVVNETEQSTISECTLPAHKKETQDIANNLELSDTDSNSSTEREEDYSDIDDQNTDVLVNDDINADDLFLCATDIENKIDQEDLKSDNREEHEASGTESKDIDADEFVDAVALWNGFVAKLKSQAKDTFLMKPFACSKCCFATNILEHLKIHVDAHLYERKRLNVCKTSNAS